MALGMGGLSDSRADGLVVGQARLGLAVDHSGFAHHHSVAQKLDFGAVGVAEGPIRRGDDQARGAGEPADREG